MSACLPSHGLMCLLFGVFTFFIVHQAGKLSLSQQDPAKSERPMRYTVE